MKIDDDNKDIIDYTKIKENGGRNMLKRISKILLTAGLCTMLFAGNAYAGKAYYSFYLSNTGTTFTSYSVSTNKKTIVSNPWTLKVESINCSGPYGIRFAPAQATSSGTLVRVCPQSAIWKNSTGYSNVNYASGDASLTYYKLAARQDNSYSNRFSSNGWWNADRLSNQ